MRKYCSWMFSVLSGLAALSGLVLTFWYVFGNLPNPFRSSMFPAFEEAARIFLWPFGLALYLAVFVALSEIFRSASRIALVGLSLFITEEKDKSALEKKMAVRHVGKLVSVVVNTDGSIIETTDGFYRVYDKVVMAKKGESVTIRKESRGLFFNFEMMSLSGKEYHLTK